MYAEVSTIVNIFYLTGIFLSVVGLIFQVLLYLLVPSSRRKDQKLLTQLTVARLLNVVFEYLIFKTYLNYGKFLRATGFALYWQTDAAVVCWMFVFTKNLYDKVINVFTPERSSFTLTPVTIWIVTIPIGLLCPLLLTLQDKEILDPLYFKIYFKSYAVMKFFVLAVNLFFVCRIYTVAFTKTDRRVCLLKTCVVCFILLSLSGAQALAEVFLNEMIGPFIDDQLDISIIIAVLNSYQVIAITIIFIILIKTSSERTLKQMIFRYIWTPFNYK